MIKSKAQTFCDGLVSVHAVESAAPPGDMPDERLVLRCILRYRERTVGLTRYYAALQANARVAYVLRCPLHREVSTQDVAIPGDGRQYRIVQVQYPEDVVPPVMDLTLEEVTQRYELAGA